MNHCDDKLFMTRVADLGIGLFHFPPTEYNISKWIVFVDLYHFRVLQVSILIAN